MQKRILCFVAVLAATPLTPAKAETLKVLVAGGYKTAMEEIAPIYERSSGNKLQITYATPTRSREIFKDGKFDVVVVAAAVLNEPSQQGEFATETRVRLAQGEVAIGVPAASTASVNVSNLESFKSSLSAFKSIAFSDPKAGTTLAATTFALADKAGVGEELRSKAKLINAPGDEVSKAVARGEADAVITLGSDIAIVPGVRLVGFLPKELQQQFPFDGAVMKQTAHQAAAADFLDYLRKPEAVSLASKAGLSVGR